MTGSRESSMGQSEDKIVRTSALQGRMPAMSRMLPRGLRLRIRHPVKTRAALRRMVGIAESRPLDLNIDATNVCPLRCVFCPNSKTRRERHVMSQALFESLCAQYRDMGGGALGLSSMQADIFSDPLLSERLEVLRSYGDVFRPYTTTNLFGAARKSDAELIDLLCCLDYMEVSIGGLSSTEYKSMYGIDGFDTVLEQLKRLAALRQESGATTELALMIRTTDPLAISRSPVLEELRPHYRINEIRSDFFSWGGLITTADLPFGATVASPNQSRQRLDCVMPWSTLSVAADGIVVGCGCVDWERRHVIGDAARQSLNEIWTSVAAGEFRTCFSRGKVPGLCSDCSLYSERDVAFSQVALATYTPQDGLYYRYEAPTPRSRG